MRPDKEYGDIETPETLKAAGIPVCKNPRQVQCRAQDHPDTSLEDLGQVVQCNLSGLLCYNKDQTKPDGCLNYQVRFLCCSYERCTEPPTADCTLAHETLTWTIWHDVSNPQFGNGDLETIDNITANGYDVCKSPRDVQCRAENDPDVPIAQVGQVVTCDQSVGLMCYNKDQPDPPCLNYQVRFLCYSYNFELCESPPTTQAPVSSTTARITPTLTHTPPIPHSSTGHFTSTISTSTTSSHTGFTLSTPSASALSSTSTKGRTTSSTIRPSSSSRHTNSITTSTSYIGGTPSSTTFTSRYPTTTSTSVSSYAPTSGTTVRTETSTKITSTFPRTTNVMSTLVSRPPPCEPKCQWTKWFDESYPTYEAEGGDNETYTVIEAAGKTVCKQHETVSDIECMAESHPGVPLADLKQKVLCELSSGLVCKNSDQKGALEMCLNYKIRVQCCEVSSNCQPITSYVTTTSPSIYTEPLIEIVVTGFTSKPQSTPTATQTQTSRKSTRIPETSTLSLATTSENTSTYRTEESTTSAATPLTTTQCFCMMNDTRHNPGEVLYSYTDDVGCVVYVRCGEDCRDQKYIASCPQTCDHLDPPREINEVWVINNCAQGICLENNTIRIDTIKCPYVEYSDCQNGLLPRQVFSSDGCCYHYECESCTGPDGKPKLPGMTWTSNCQLCTCDAETITVNCTPIKCLESSPPICDQEGFELVETQMPDNPCCTTILCRCNNMNCRNISETCPAGFKSVVNHVEGVCCPTFTCEPDQVCVFNETTYQPGWSIPLPKSSCEECTCTHAKDAETKLNQIFCMEMSCQTECPLGYEYQAKENQCCGECVQVACIVKLGQTRHIIQPEHKWSPPGMSCVTYQCSKDNTDRFELITENRTCPVYRPDDCSPEDLTEIQYDACCKLYVCVQVASCKVHKKTIRIQRGDCWTTAELAFCEGSCSSLSMFSTMKGTMERTCTCCQELRTSKKKVQLDCPDSRRTDDTYINAEECGCRGAVCTEQ